MSNEAISLSKIQPDFDFILGQLQRAARNRATWNSFLTTDVGKTLLEFMSAIGELDQYSISRTFEQMFSETADLDSSLYGITKMLGVRLNRKSPPQTFFRLPDASNSGSGNSGSTANDFILKQAYLNPYYDISIPLGGGATPAASRITNPILFYSYGKLKRIVSAQFPATSTLIIKPYSRFSSSEGELFNRLPIKFDPITDVANPNDSGWYGYIENEENPAIKEAPVLYRGNVSNKFFIPSGQDFFSIISSENDFTISNQDVEVYVNQQKLQVVTNGLWNYRLNEVDNNVVQDITTSKGKLHILFGSDLYGYKPTVNDTIRLRYVTTNGIEDNVLKFKSTKLGSSEYPIDNNSDSCINPLIDGENQTTASEYSTLGPFLFASNNGQRGVTPQDYKVIFDTYPGNLDSAIDGQRNLNVSSPAFMNLIRVVTYPKHNELFYKTMFADVKQRTMYSPEFYTEWASPDVPLYPIQRIFNVRANVYCFNLVDLVTGRQAIESAILQLVDKVNLPQYSKLNTNIARETILRVMREAVDGIDYIELIEPSTDVVVDMISPKPYTTANSGIPTLLTGAIDYAVEVLCEDNNQASSTQRSWGLSDYFVATGIGESIRVYFEKAPNFTYTTPNLISLGITSYPYLRNVRYRLWRRERSVPNPVWKAVNAPIIETALPVDPATNLTYIEDLGNSTSVPNPAFPRYNAARPSVALLDSNWLAVNCINMFYTSRG